MLPALLNLKTMEHFMRFNRKLMKGGDADGN